MFVKLRPRRSTTTEWEMLDPVLKEGELGVEYPDTGVGTGLCKFKLGDGYTRWTELPYAFNAEEADSIHGGTVTVSHEIGLRSGTIDEWSSVNPTLALGEPAFDITNNAIKIGDGEHTFNEIAYIGSKLLDDYDFGNINRDDIIDHD